MTIRFSVLLPTRNGGAFIADCIHSVLSQDFVDFELIVSDNANEDDTPRILAGIADPRLKVVRQTRVLSVHENWNATLDVAQGEYVLMLGDDDYLLPGALRRLDRVLSSFGDPDCALFNGFSFAAPNSIDTGSDSYWAPFHHRYDSSFAAGVMDRKQRMSIVRDMFRFRQRIPLNMQTVTFSMRSIRTMDRPVFRAPFPDHYLLNSLLITAATWVYVPERFVIVGVSPKSFGHYFYRQQGSSGLAYLGIQTQFPGALPGNELLNGMYQWLMLLCENHRKALEGVSIDRSAYLIRQVRFWWLQARHGAISRAELVLRFGLISAKDWSLLVLALFDTEVWRRLLSNSFWRRQNHAEALWAGLRRIPNVVNCREFSNWLDEHGDGIEKGLLPPPIG